MAFKLVPRCFLFTSFAQNLSKLSFSSYVSSHSNELSPANELELEFREHLKPSLPSLQTSNDADTVANILIEHHDPYNAVESPLLHLNGIRVSTELVQQTMIRLKNVSSIALDFFIMFTVAHIYKPDLSLDNLSSMKEKGIFPTVATYTSVIKCLCSCGKLEDAEEILNEMVANEVSSPPTTFSYFFKEFQGRKHADNAFKLYNKMGDLSCTPSLSTYNILVGKFSRLNKMDIVQDIWKDMKVSGAGPDSDSYTLLIHGLCEKRKWAEACEFV
ncbi:hypothetical protein MKX03_013768 [Papaver bracteatum]|nr:hypothetical protein MKX03_013768 [Papaver bracteatum]